MAQTGAILTAVRANGAFYDLSNTEALDDQSSMSKFSKSTAGVVRKENKRTAGKSRQQNQLASDLLDSKDEVFSEGSATILQWGGIDGENANEAELHKCKRGTCLFTSDRAKINEATAVTWYLPSLSLDDMPKQRPKGQLWVASMDESPCAYDASRSRSLLLLFNIAVSMSDRAHVRTCPYVDQDVLHHLDAPALPTKIKDEFRRNGTGLVAYIQSNCLGHRDNFVKALEAEGIQVDSFGPCHHNKDYPRGFENLKAWVQFDKPEFSNFERRYKFAIAFENCQCQDYVTEKMYRRLHAGVVPIYEPGALDMATWLPAPHSIINVSAFSSVQMLAQELKRLDADPVAYEGHLAWKERGISGTPLGDVLDQCVKVSDKCAVCDEVLKQRSEGSQSSLAESPPFGICPSEEQTDIEDKVRAFTKLSPHLEFVPLQGKSS